MNTPDNRTGGQAARVCVGVVIGARGVKGDVRIKSFTDDPEDIGAYGPVEIENAAGRFDVKVTGVAKGVVTARLKEVRNRDQAEALKGARLFVNAARLPEAEEDEFYVSDLIGLNAMGPDGSLGVVKGVEDFGAGDVLEIRGGEFGAVLVPFTKVCVPEVRLSEGVVVIDPPDGLLDDPPQKARGDDRGKG